MSIEVPGGINQAIDAPGGAQRKPLTELTFDHVGMVVNDCDETMRRFADTLGITRWHRSVFRTPSEYNGIPGIIGGTVAVGSLGPISLELVQPTEGSWTAADALAARGEHIYHLGYRVPDIVAAIDRGPEANLELGLRGLDVTQRSLFAYMNRADLPAMTIELVGPYIPEEGFLLELREVVLD